MEEADNEDIIEDAVERYAELEILRAGIFARRKGSAADADIDRMVSELKQAGSGQKQDGNRRYL